MAINTPIPAQQDSPISFRSWLRQPRVAGALIIGYLAVALLVLITLDRGNLLFPLWSTLAFPPFILPKNEAMTTNGKIRNIVRMNTIKT